MAASTPPERPADDETERAESAVGMAHLTVVPTNFESVEGDDQDA